VTIVSLNKRLPFFIVILFYALLFLLLLLYVYNEREWVDSSCLGIAE